MFTKTLLYLFFIVTYIFLTNQTKKNNHPCDSITYMFKHCKNKILKEWLFKGNESMQQEIKNNTEEVIVKNKMITKKIIGALSFLTNKTNKIERKINWLQKNIMMLNKTKYIDHLKHVKNDGIITNGSHFPMLYNSQWNQKNSGNITIYILIVIFIILTLINIAFSFSIYFKIKNIANVQ